MEILVKDLTPGDAYFISADGGERRTFTKKYQFKLIVILSVTQIDKKSVEICMASSHQATLNNSSLSFNFSKAIFSSRAAWLATSSLWDVEKL